MKQPLCWITNDFDRSPAELVWVETGHRPGGRCEGSLLNLSYGNGKVFVVPHEIVDGQIQGGMCALPIPPFPTGIMRGPVQPGRRPALRLRHVRLGRQPDPARRVLPRPLHRQADVRAGRPEGPEGWHRDYVHRPARPQGRERPDELRAQDVVAEADGQLRLQPHRRASGADHRREGLRRRPDGVPRDPRDPADLVHGNHLCDPRRASGDVVEGAIDNSIHRLGD